MSDDALTEQIRDELTRIIPIVSELTGLPSNWNGALSLVPDAKFRGKKLYSCGILIDAQLATQDARWRTLIHEAIHAVSVGYIRSDYDTLIGWEEGVVEQLQRLLRRDILAALSVNIDEQVFWAPEQDLYYNRYIDALELIRQALAVQDSLPFYTGLLSVPIQARPGNILNQSLRLVRADQGRFVRLFSALNPILKEGDKQNVGF